ncbi:MAG: HAD hydrolase-like protein, partial [Lachnospiraceae bacterium]
MTKEVVDSIIFDLDGTLWDSTEQVVKAWNQVISKHNEVIKGITPQDIKGVMGLQIKEIGKKFFPYLDEEVQMKVMDECCKTECELLRIHGGSLYEKLEETLKVLTESYKLFIVSNCACGYIEAFLEAHNLEKYFIDFENPGRTGLSKGENIKIIIERNNLSNP